MKLRTILFAGSLLLQGVRLAGAEAGPPLLLQTPTLSRTQIAFAYGGDIWTVDRSGGDAHRLVGPGSQCANPVFSPDGSKIAFNRYEDGNMSVFFVDAAGGNPVRLTYCPGYNGVLGWTPDGMRILFASGRASPRDLWQMYTVSLAGGHPAELPLPSGAQAAYSPDATHLAYVPFYQVQPAWKMYRGGQTTPIWIADLSDSSVVKIPRDNSNDRNPMWVGETVYFLSDREGRFTLFSYDTKTREVRRLMANDDFDIGSASAGPGAIVYSKPGSLHLFDLASGTSSLVAVRIAADTPHARPHFEKVKPEQILNVALSPTGKRALFEAHGEILSVPAEKGDVRNLTQSPGVADRDPAWSPDGKSIAYFSDESGEYALHIRSQDGLGAPKKIELGPHPSFFYSPTWSPDSSKIAYTDKHLRIWYVPVEGGAPVDVDADLYDGPFVNIGPSWSPDSQWIAYSKQLPNHQHAVFIYSVPGRVSRQVTDGMSDAQFPRFDRNGKYLYFTVSTNMALAAGWLDMSSMDHSVTSEIYCAVLRKDLPSPVAPESDEEGAAKEGDAEKGKDAKGSSAAEKDGAQPAPTLTPAPSSPPTPTGTPHPTSAPTPTSGLAAAGAKAGAAKVPAPAVAKAEKDDSKAKEKPAVEPVVIDFDGLDQRIVAMPLPVARYVGLATGKDGVLFTVMRPEAGASEEHGPKLTVTRFDIAKRKPEKVAEGVDAFLLSFNGEKMLVGQDSKWFLNDSEKAPEKGKGQIAADRMEVYVDPRAEWKQMYREAWRIERDFFYDPGYHGLDIAAAQRLYEPYLAGIANRSDLSELFREMTGWFVVGHMFVGGAGGPSPDRVSVGLLGADYTVENGLYRIAKIYLGENWNPDLQAPLTRPGVHVSTGDYLFAVNGQELKGSDEVYRLFQETAGKQTSIKVGPSPDGAGSHVEIVVPIDSESNLRYRAWITANRLKVDELSGGRLAYVHIPDTGRGGFTNFNRYYFTQVGKQGAILDERFNHGGLLADYIVDLLYRPVRMTNHARDGEDYTEPAQAIVGPKVMLINQMSGSGGDALPWMFKTMKAGTLVGTRTWGGLVGIGGYPRLIDGGTITAPRFALYGVKGEWEVENHGIAPDVEVEMDPKLVRQGHDPQLERAVAIALEQLASNPPPRYSHPPFPNYHQKLPTGPAAP